MRFIFEDVAKKVLTPARFLKYQLWIEQAEKARKTRILDAKKNQYDKAEELITFYAFAPLEVVPSEVRNEVVRKLLSLVDIDEPVREVELHFEKDLSPPNGYLKYLSKEVKRNPIRYIRKQADARVQAKKKLEGHTQVDVMIKTDALLILVEVKFTSDISSYTKFGLIRNQISRLIDVGIEEANRGKTKRKLVVLLSTPTRARARI